jgi:energy-coupling factor transport system ATP-binding protein
MSSIEIKGLSFTYSGQTEKTLKNINIHIEDGSFTVLCGATGSGKTTLLRLIKREIAPAGTVEGAIELDGVNIKELSERDCVALISFVNQRPEVQIVCDKVWHELAFTLEGLGADSELIRRRCAEVRAFLGIDELFNSDTAALSGGQQQALCLASALSTKPSVLILDEPLSRLDPVSATQLTSSLLRINRELGITVLICEHRLENLLDTADKLIVMDSGKVLWQGCPENIAEMPASCAVEKNLPASVRLFKAVGGTGKCPLNAAQGRIYFKDKQFNSVERIAPTGSEAVLSAKGLYFGYSKSKLVLKDTEVKLMRGEHYALMGGNGSGKSTLLYVLAGAYKAIRGKVKANGKIVMLPQNPVGLFSADTLREELGDDKMMEEFALSSVSDKNPLDLSGGQQQLAAFVMALRQKPDILLLDEPTKALDGECKELLGKKLKELTASGATVLTVSHDTEFCARYADRCAMLFDGKIISEDNTFNFFTTNICYTTPVCRMTGGKLLTVEEASDGGIE